MYDPSKKMTRLTRQKRRLIAAIVVMAGSAIAAGPNVSAAPQDPVNRPLLPLQWSKGDTPKANRVKQNPFCEPPANSRMSPVRLASGGDNFHVRLQPIGTAVGLQTVGEDDFQQAESPSILIEKPAASEVQENPLAADAWQPAKTGLMQPSGVETSVENDTDKASANVEPINNAVSENRSQRRSSIVLLPQRSPIIDARDPEVSDPVAAIEEATDSTDLLADQAVPVEALPVESETEPEVEPEPEGPFSFSFSDQDQEPPAPIDVNEPQGNPGLPAPVNLEHELALDETVENETVDLVPMAESQPQDEPAPLAKLNTAPAGLSLDQVQPFVIESADDTAAKELGIGKPRKNKLFVEKKEPETVGRLVPRAEPSLHTKRYRPPVAVHHVPIAIESESAVGVTVAAPVKLVRQKEAVVDATTGNSGPIESSHQSELERLVAAAKATPLYMDRTQVRSLTLGAELGGMKVVDKSICQAFASGPNQLKLIGTGSGVTKLVVWAKPVDENSKPRVRAFEIHVKDQGKDASRSLQEKIDVLNHSIAQAFPNANVDVKAVNHAIVVAGQCLSEADAKKIVRVVRKTCSVSVRDELKVR